MENKRKFSKEEIKEIKKIVKQESEVLQERPLYMVGDITLLVLMYYFTSRWFGINDFSWATQKNIFIITVLFVFILIGYKLYYRNLYYRISFGITTWILTSLILIRSSPMHYDWVYFAYMILLFVGVMCLKRAITSYFCKKIYMSQKQQESPK